MNTPGRFDFLVICYQHQNWFTKKLLVPNTTERLHCVFITGESRLLGVFCTNKCFCTTTLVDSPVYIFITSESLLPSDEYTEESRLHGGEYTVKSRLSGGRCTGESITNLNYSTKMKNLVTLFLKNKNQPKPTSVYM